MYFILEKGGNETMTSNRIFSMSFNKVYPLYIAKAERKSRTKREVDEIIFWLFGYNEEELETHLKKGTNFETFIKESPLMNPLRAKITGKVCGITVEDIEDPIMKEIRYLDKLIDELAKGKSLEKILRS